MSRQSASGSDRDETSGDFALTIVPREKDLGEFTVRRVLPAARRRMVGPFIFFDHMGPAEFPPGRGINVRPHPHIGLATITYLFEGEIMHRDSLGYVQPILSGAVNLMTAGRGIVHSERAGSDLEVVSRLHGIQSWMALPDGQEEVPPAFEHFAADRLPQLDLDGVTVRVIIGDAYGAASPVATLATTLYLELKMTPGSSIELPRDCDELGFYVVAGAVESGTTTIGPGMMAVANAGDVIRLDAESPAHVMVIGGESLGQRHIWWNFVSSSRERMKKAGQDWTAGRFEKVPGETEFIPLPDD